MSQRRGADRAAYSQRNHSDDSTPPPPQPPNEQQQPAQPWTRGGRGRSRPWTRGGATTRGNSSSWGNQSRPAWGNDSTATGLPAPSWSTPPPASTSDSHVARGPDRLRPAPALRNVQHEFDALPLMSRMNEVGGRDDVERAKTRSVQESFYAYVLEQYKRLCEVPPSERKANHFDSLVAKLRKLREALTASDATDTFMRDVYELSVDVSLRARNFAEMLKALAALVGRMYDVLDGRDAQTFSPRRAEFTSFMLLYLCCYASGIRPLHPPAASSTAPKSSTSPARDLLQTYRKTPAPLQSHPRVLFAMGVARAVRADVDYVALAGYWERASWGELVFLERLQPHLGDRVLQIISKAYFTFPDRDLSRYIAPISASSSSASQTSSAHDPDSSPTTINTASHARYMAALTKHVAPDGVETRVVGGVVQLRVVKKAKPKTTSELTSAPGKSAAVTASGADDGPVTSRNGRGARENNGWWDK